MHTARRVHPSAPTQNPRRFQETHEEHRGGFNVERWSCSRFLKSGMHHFFFSSYVKFPAPRLPAAGGPSCTAFQDAGFNTEAEALEQSQLVSHKLLEMNDCFETSLCRMNGIKRRWSFRKTFLAYERAALETHVVQIIVNPPPRTPWRLTLISELFGSRRGCCSFCSQLQFYKRWVQIKTQGSGLMLLVLTQVIPDTEK